MNVDVRRVAEARRWRAARKARGALVPAWARDALEWLWMAAVALAVIVGLPVLVCLL